MLMFGQSKVRNLVGKSGSREKGLQSQIKLEGLPALPFGQITGGNSLNFSEQPFSHLSNGESKT